MIISKVVLIILLKVQQGKGKIVKNYGYLWRLMKTKKGINFISLKNLISKSKKFIFISEKMNQFFENK
jgi:hypothetical protein